jgi:hypothetical protein
VTERIAAMHAFLEEIYGYYHQVAKLSPTTLRRLVKWLPGLSKAKGEK